MNFRRLAALALASLLSIAYAQDEEARRPQTEIPDFSNLDEYIYEPKSTVHLSFRMLSGAKADFSGTGQILAPEGALPEAGVDVRRDYHDGFVGPDLRATPRSDVGGNPTTDPALDPTSSPSDPIPSDGRTNNWSYEDDTQVSGSPIGYIAFHQYSADVIDTAVRRRSSRSTAGLDLAVSRDMGSLFGGRFSWRLVGGLSINDVSARHTDDVKARIKTITDYYSTFGQGVPPAPYTAPSTTSSSFTDPNGVVQTIPVDTSVLISRFPVLSRSGVLETMTNVQNTWKVKGAYYTFRAGPELVMPFTSRFRLSVSAGLAAIYVGTQYTVTEVFEPDLGDEITEVDSDGTSRILPGWFVDASLIFDVTEKTGFFAGGIMQGATSYTQSLNTTTSKYAAKVDLSQQTGFRAGMSIRF